MRGPWTRKFAAEDVVRAISVVALIVAPARVALDRFSSCCSCGKASLDRLALDRFSSWCSYGKSSLDTVALDRMALDRISSWCSHGEVAEAP